MAEIECTAPFKDFVLNVKVCGEDGRTGKTAVLLLFMEPPLPARARFHLVRGVLITNKNHFLGYLSGFW